MFAVVVVAVLVEVAIAMVIQRKQIDRFFSPSTIQLLLCRYYRQLQANNVSEERVEIITEIFLVQYSKGY